MRNLIGKIRIAYIIELLIVIIGVSIAFWLNQLSENYKESQLRKSYLEEIQTDLKRDVKVLDYSIKFNSKKRDKMSNGLKLFSDIENNKDSIIYYAIEVGNYYFFVPDDITYKSMIASGDYKLLTNKEIKKGLIKLNIAYKNIDEIQKNYLKALDDNYFPFLGENFNYLKFKVHNQKFFKSLKVQNTMIFTVIELKEHIKNYNYVKKLANQIDSLISIELAQN